MLLIIFYLDILTSFYVTTGSIFSIELSIENFKLLQGFSIGKSFILIFGSKIWWSEDARKYYQYWYVWIFNLKFLSNQQFDSFHQGLNWMLCIFRARFNWKAIRFNPCIRILSPKNPFSALDFALSRSWNWCFSVTAGFIPLTGSKSKDPNRILIAREFQRVLLNWFNAMFSVSRDNFLFRRNLGLDFLHQSLNPKLQRAVFK